MHKLDASPLPWRHGVSIPVKPVNPIRLFLARGSLPPRRTVLRPLAPQPVTPRQHIQPGLALWPCAGDFHLTGSPGGPRSIL